MNTSGLMALRRPDVVEQQNRTSFETASVMYEGISPTYKYFGRHIRYHWPAFQIDSDDILKDGFNVLDLGCGHGRVVRDFVERSTSNRGIGYTACDYSEGTNPYVKVGDIQDLHQLLNRDKVIDPFQVVMSAQAFMHLSDPFSAMEQAARVTDRCGLLIFDSFLYRREHNEKLSSTVIRYLLGSGHFIIEGGDTAALMAQGIEQDYIHSDSFMTMPELALRRISDVEKDITLPVDYATESTNSRGWHYIVA